MGDLLYPAIPDPIQTPESLLETAVALKQAVELLNGQRLGTGTTKAMTAGDLKYVFGTPLPPGAVPPPVDTSGVSAALAAARASVQLALLELRNAAENAANTLNNETQQSLTEFQLLLDQEEQDRIDGDDNIQQQVDSIILTNNEGAIAAIAEETVLRIESDNLLAGAISTLSGTVDGNAVAISDLQVARVDDAEAVATAINTVTAVASKQRVFTQSTPPVGTVSNPLIVGDIWIDTVNGNLLKVWDGGAWVAYDDTRINLNSIAITTEQEARADADTAIGHQLETIEGNVDDNHVLITNEQTARVDADDALAQDITTLEGRVGDNEVYIANELALSVTAGSALAVETKALRAEVNDTQAVIDEQLGVYIDANTTVATVVTNLSTTVGGHTSSITTQQGSINGLMAEYSVTLNANGHIAGFNINSGGPVSEFIVQADKFKIVQSTGGVLLQPFTVLAGNTYINRVIVNQEIISSNYAQDVSGNPTAGFRAGSDGLLRAYDARFVNLKSIGGTFDTGTFINLTADEATFIDFTARGGTFIERPIVTEQPIFRNGVQEGLPAIRQWVSPGNILWNPALAWLHMTVFGFHRTPDVISASLNVFMDASTVLSFNDTVAVPPGKRAPSVLPLSLSGNVNVVEFRDDGSIVRVQYTGNGAVNTTNTAFGKWMFSAERDPLNLEHLNKIIAGLGITRRPFPIVVPEFLANGTTPVTTASFKCWGGGGGRDDGGGQGGPGGYVAGTFAVGAKGSSALIKRGDVVWLIAGEGGKTGSQDVVLGFGGKGQSQQRRSGGGGLSGAFLYSVSLANMLLCAGGGGGAEGGQSGGPGGAAASGGNGASGTDDAIMTGLPWTFDGTNSKGGGGGGRIGGGWLSSVSNRAGGRGGTNFILPGATATTNSASSVSANGNATTSIPPNTGDADWVANQFCLGNIADAGQGKTSNLEAETGGNGLVVVTYA